MNTTIEKVKERPILFSTPMVVAVLDDRKDITRRTKGLEEINKKPDDWKFHEINVLTNEFILFNHAEHNGSNTNECYRLIKCPYGQVGEVLWVRETWVQADTDCGWACENGCVCPTYWYKAGGPTDYEIKWKPSIHMPRAACRLRLEIKSIRVERLHDITEEDAIREGIRKVTKDNNVFKYCVYDQSDYSSTPWTDMPKSAKVAFQNLWQLINGAESWNSNPWVWRIEFKRI